MDKDQVRRALTLDSVWIGELRRAWAALMEFAVFGDVKAARLGAMGKLRKRVLDLGERLRSLSAERDWIPHPREQLKNALASAFGVKESLRELERALGDVDGGTELAAFRAAAAEITELVTSRLPELENRWAELLDAQYRDEEAPR